MHSMLYANMASSITSSLMSKFTGQQPFQIHICLYFAVELFAFSVHIVQVYDIMVIHPQVFPPYIGFDVIEKQELAIPISRAVHDLIPRAYSKVFPLICLYTIDNQFPVASKYRRIDGFAVLGHLNVFATDFLSSYY